jgi:dipeptidyl aminopeptidase/acylaminoacyl peptidase
VSRAGHVRRAHARHGGPSIGLAAIILGALALLVDRAALSEGLRPYSVDDYLKLEDTGAAIADPTGHWIVWEQAPPYDQLQDYGQGITGTWQGGSFRLMAINLDRGALAPLFPPAPATAYTLGGFSPGGRYLSFVSVRAGRVHLGVFDFLNRRTREIGAAPLLRSVMSQPEAEWISRDRLVCAVFPRGEGPISLVFREGAGDRLAASWRKSWRGKMTSVDVAASHAADAPLPLPGRLLEFNAATGATRELAEGRFASLTVSHDGRYLAALRQWPRAQPAPGVPDLDWVYSRSRLFVFDLNAHAPGKPVAEGEDVLPDTLEWAPDADRLAFFAWQDGRGVRAGTFHTLVADTGVVTPIPHAGLDLVSERERGGPQRPERAVWIDGRLAVFARQNEAGDRSPRFTYRDRDLSSGDPKTAGGSSNLRNRHWYLLDPEGNPMSLTEGLDDISAVPLYADGKSLFVLARGKLWQLTPGRAPAQLDPTVSGRLALPPAALTSDERARFRPEITLVSNTAAGSAMVLVDLQSGDAILLPMKPGSIPLTASSSGRALLLRNGVGQGSEIALQTAEGGYSVLLRLNPHLDDVEKLEWSSFRYKLDASSDDVEGCLLLPAHYRSGLKYPTIVEVYPNRPAFCSDPSYRSRPALGAHPGAYSEYLLAARGFIVFRPDTHRVPPSSAAAGPLAGMNASVDRGIDAVIAAGYADPARLGLMGFSQGGFASLWLATQSERYSAVVSVNGWSDMYSESMQGYLRSELYPDQMPFMGDLARYEATAGFDLAMGASPWKDPEKYIRNSPLFNAPAVSAPILLIHSDMDGWGPQYDMMFTALYTHRKEAELRIYRGEGHGPSSPANIRDMWHRIFYWFDHYLHIERDAHGDMILAGGDTQR